MKYTPYLIIVIVVTQTFTFVSSLSGWDDVFKKFPNVLENLPSDEQADIFTILGPVSGPDPENDKAPPDGTDIYSLALPPNLTISYEQQRVQKQDIYYTLDKEKVCKDRLAIQQATYLLDSLEVLLPYRSVALVDCTGEKAPNVSLPTGKRTLNLKGVGQKKATIINGKHLVPNITFTIDNRTIRIESERESVNIIAAIDFFVNIENKTTENLEVGQFSYRNPDYKRTFSEYALTTPFSQSILLQINNLGAKFDHYASPTWQEMAINASFHDVVYCGLRFCNGSYFEGFYDTPLAHRREDLHSEAFVNINRMLNENNKFSDSMRTVINQRSQYSDRAQYLGFTALKGQCYVSESASAFGNYTQNQLPHLLGQTYKLYDNTGDMTPDDKLVSYALRTNLELFVPWNESNFRAYTGSMNDGQGYGTKLDYYTRFSRYGNKIAHDVVANASRDVPEKFWHSLEMGYRTILMVIEGNEVMGFIINTYAPPSILLPTVPTIGLGDKYVRLYRFKDYRFVELKFIDVSVNKHFTLPSYWVLNTRDTFTVEYMNKRKRFYLTDEGRKMPVPYVGIRPDLFDEVEESNDDDKKQGDEETKTTTVIPEETTIAEEQSETNTTTTPATTTAKTPDTTTTTTSATTTAKTPDTTTTTTPATTTAKTPDTTETTKTTSPAPVLNPDTSTSTTAKPNLETPSESEDAPSPAETPSDSENSPTASETPSDSENSPTASETPSDSENSPTASETEATPSPAETSSTLAPTDATTIKTTSNDDRQPADTPTSNPETQSNDSGANTPVSNNPSDTEDSPPPAQTETDSESTAPAAETAQDAEETPPADNVESNPSPSAQEENDGDGGGDGLFGLL